jgi:uncharacterized protein YndB with AHSA1/START domain
MSVTSIDKDTENLTLTLIADFDAPIQRVWELWADPRKLERWWGPPGYPATFERYDLTPGGEVAYFMTTPEGDRPHGWWRFTAVDAPRSLAFTAGFADENGAPLVDMPASEMDVSLVEHGGGTRTRMQMRSTFGSLEQMEKVMEMGMVEGLREAAGQMDALLAA